jgi:GMP synthase-like glutamine amidotransferase
VAAARTRYSCCFGRLALLRAAAQAALAATATAEAGREKLGGCCAAAGWRAESSFALHGSLCAGASHRSRSAAMPRVAVLDCDGYKPFPPNVGFHYYGECAQQWLSDPGDKDKGWVWVQFRVHAEGQLPTLAEVDDFDGFVIPGSACNVSDNEPWIQPLCAVIRAAHARSKGLFGMCFGHQIIAHALGGCVAAAPPFNFTIDELSIVEPEAAAHVGLDLGLVAEEEEEEEEEEEGGAVGRGCRSTLRLYKSHGYQVVRPPPGAVVLACSARTPIEMWALADNVVCCQVS